MQAYSIILLISIAALPPFDISQEPGGRKMYEANCLRCHGKEGKNGFLGRGKLIRSNLDDERAALIIRNGKRAMPSLKTL